MEKSRKRAFSLIELLFVMIILAALSGIAIPLMQSSEQAAIKSSMTSDLRNMVSLSQIDFIETHDYSTAAGTFIDTNNDGRAEELMNGKNINISEGNKITIVNKDCDGNGDDNDGIIITVENDKVPEDKVFNTCTQVIIK